MAEIEQVQIKRKIIDYSKMIDKVTRDFVGRQWVLMRLKIFENPMSPAIFYDWTNQGGAKRSSWRM